MKKRKYLKPALCLFLSCCMLWIQCCTIAGYYIDSKSGEKQEIVEFIHTDIQQIKPGTSVYVHLLDGANYVGTFEGVDTLSRDQYEIKYGQNKKQKNEIQNLPDIRDSIEIRLNWGPEERCEFKGFDYGIQDDSLRYTLIARRANRTRDSYFKMEYMAGFSDEKNQFIETEQLIQFINQGLIPVKTYIMVQDSCETHMIGLNEISTISLRRIKPDQKSAGTATIVGILLDITITYTIYIISVREKILDTFFGE